MPRLTLSVLVGAITFLITTSAQHETHDQLGKVSFPTSCTATAQAEFERGVAMLHSYWFNYAGKSFRAVLEHDPACAIAYWGLALDLLGNTLSAPPSVEAARAAWDLLEKARAVQVKTERERDWIEAIRTYFRDHETVPVDTRLLAYNRTMEQLAERYPGDFEAQVFYALTLQASAPKSDVTYANQFTSAAILETLYAQNPQHPGITHYLIHAYDFAPVAEKGIAAARRYAAIAPAVPHARHMPAHIYSMVGLWEDSIRSNLSALEIQPDYYHAADFTVYAHLQLAQDAKAKAMMDKALTTPERGDRPTYLGHYTARTAMPARYALERADWAAAARLPMIPTGNPQADSITRFTRAFGMARTGNVRGAKLEIDALQALQAALAKAGDSYWAERTHEQILAASAWLAHAEGARDPTPTHKTRASGAPDPTPTRKTRASGAPDPTPDPTPTRKKRASGAPARAIALMRNAADSEDRSIKHVAMENRLYPMRELLGDLLFEAGRPTAALAEYVKALKQSPNRYRGIYGAARAAAAAGDRQRAADYYSKLILLSKNADGSRPELQQARAYLAKP